MILVEEDNTTEEKCEKQGADKERDARKTEGEEELM